MVVVNKKFFRFALILFILFYSNFLVAQAKNDCGPEGSAKTKRLKELNQKKNRTIFPDSTDFDRRVTLQTLLEPGDDSMRWSDTCSAEIIGYIIEVRMSAPESCNCFSKDPYYRDTHIEIVADPMTDSKRKRVVIEVTPRIREIMKTKGIDWTTKALRDNFLGRWVKVQGWLFFDSEHKDEAENTKPGRSRNWRATAWEIHPVTSIEIVDRPR